MWQKYGASETCTKSTVYKIEHNVYSTVYIILPEMLQCLEIQARARILVQVTINRRLLIGRDGHLDQSEAYDLS